MTNPDRRTIYIISDGTGETASTMVKAAIVQYHDRDINIVRCKNVRTEEQLDSLLDEVEKKKGLVVFTVASRNMRKRITESCHQKSIISTDLLSPLLEAFESYFGGESAQQRVGVLHSVDDRYFRRIEAIEYTVKHDDGKSFNQLEDADIILVGISRTSKTPLSIFLSHKGLKVANIPLVLDSPPPEQLFKVDQRKIVGLMIDADALHRIRRKRLEKFGQDPGGEYASREHILKEIEFATNLYKQNRRWPVFNITDRALEETAGEIIRIISSRVTLPIDALL